jgi:hypothetical protein
MDYSLSDFNIKYYNDKIIIFYYFYDGFMEDAFINKYQTANLIKEGFSKTKFLKTRTKAHTTVNVREGFFKI